MAIRKTMLLFIVPESTTTLNPEGFSKRYKVSVNILYIISKGNNRKKKPNYYK